MRISAFIFDLDGVIADTAEYHYLSWKRLADEEDIPFTREENERLRGLSRRESLHRILKGRSIGETAIQMYMQRKNDYYLEYLKQITPAPGVRRFLAEAERAGIKIGLGSASQNAREVLEWLGLLDSFAIIGDGLSVQNGKPAPDLFLWVADGLGVKPSETVVFEDGEAGIEAALAGSFWTVGVGSAQVSHAHIVVPDFEQITVRSILRRLDDIGSLH